MKVSVIAICHPEFDNLFLHGKRRDNGKWTLPGGKADTGESSKKAAIRELKEETGLDAKNLCLWGTKKVKKGNKTTEISLFTDKCPKKLNLKVAEDPDLEMSCFKFLDPLSHGNLHVPLSSNILKDYIDAKK